MALADKEPEARNANRFGCALGKLMATMPEAERDLIYTWFESKKYSDKSIAARITEEYPGFQGGGGMVQRHRAKSCGCAR